MKSRRKFSSLVVLLFITVMLSTTVEAQHRSRPGGKHKTRTQQQYQKRSGPKGAVGAPLDGGLLALLAGAGITYFAARKKKKKMQE